MRSKSFFSLLMLGIICLTFLPGLGIWREPTEEIEIRTTDSFSTQHSGVKPAAKAYDLIELDISSEIFDVKVRGNYAYLAAFRRGFIVVDISDPENPQEIASLSANLARDVEVVGNFAYFANQTGFLIYDITDPRYPTKIYENTTSAGLIYGVGVSGDYAVVCEYSTTASIRALNIYDISDPYAPVYHSRVSTPTSSFDAEVVGDYIYVACRDGGLAVFNFTDPAKPVFLDNVVTTRAFELAIEGNIVYSADQAYGYDIIDISNPQDPQSLISQDLPGYTYDVDVEGDWAYFAVQGQGLAQINVSDPTNPSDPIYRLPGETIRSICVDGDYCFIGTNDGDFAGRFCVTRIASPPVFQDTYSRDISGQSNALWVDGNYVYVASGAPGLAVVNITDPTNPGVPIICNTGEAKDLWVEGDLVYIADGPDGIVIVNVTYPAIPQVNGTKAISGSASSIFVEGNFAYVAAWSGGYAIYNISDPTAPGDPVTNSTDVGTICEVWVDGDVAFFMASYWQGLYLVNVSDPTNPVPIGTIALTSENEDLWVEGELVYVTHSSKGLGVINVTDPENPETPTYFDVGGDASSVWIEGNYAFVGCQDYIRIVDISDPWSMKTYDTITTGDWVNDLWIAGEYLFRLENSKGLNITKYRQLFDNEAPSLTFTDPTEMELFGILAPDVTATGSDISGIDEKWYSLNDSSQTKNASFTSNVAQADWALFGNGTVTMTVGINDTFGNANTGTIVLLKDIIAPGLALGDPDLNESSFITPPSLAIQVTEANLDSIYYTINDNQTRHALTEGNVTLDEATWSSLEIGNVTILVVANDTMANQRTLTIVVKKATVGTGNTGAGTPDWREWLPYVIAIAIAVPLVTMLYFKKVRKPKGESETPTRIESVNPETPPTT